MRQITILSIAIYLSGCFSRVPPVKTGLEKKALPEFRLLLSDSTTYINTRDISKQSPFIMFCFGPHCPYSRAEMKEILNSISLLKDYKLYAITAWPFQEMKDFYHDFNLKDYKNITTGYDIANVFQNYYSIPGVPFLAIYGKERKLRQAFVGKISAEQIKEVIDR